MKITPLDIQQHEFQRSLFGLDPREVRNFLDLVRETVEELVRENAAIREEMTRREGEVHRYRERERLLQETLLTAQRLSEDLKASAHKEAEIIVSQAELRGEKILHNAHQRLVKFFEEIQELKRQKIQFQTGMKRLLDWHQKLLEAQAEGEQRFLEIEENVQILDTRREPPPRPAEERREEKLPRAVG
jgi:cell division initiation protein